jgi:type IV pilus assembly protein PilA
MNNQLFYYLLNKNKNQGFTWWQVLLAFIIILIAFAIALPSFIVQTSPELKLFEGKRYVSTMNRGQQAYFLENKKFAHSLKESNLGITMHTTNYNYSIKTVKDSVYNYGIARTENFQSYIGGVFILPNYKDLETKIVTTWGIITVPANPAQEKTEMTTISILCINDKSGTIIPPEPIFKNGIPSCGVGTTQLK